MVGTEALAPPDTEDWLLLENVEGKLGGGSELLQTEAETSRAGLNSNPPAELLLEVHHVLVTLCVVRRLSLHEVVQAAQVVRLTTQEKRLSREHTSNKTSLKLHTWVLPTPSSSRRVISACRSNSLWVILSSCSA